MGRMKEPFKEEFTLNTEILVHVLGINLFKTLWDVAEEEDTINTGIKTVLVLQQNILVYSIYANNRVSLFYY